VIPRHVIAATPELAQALLRWRSDTTADPPSELRELLPQAAIGPLVVNPSPAEAGSCVSCYWPDEESN
jgi:hypothetical protein